MLLERRLVKILNNYNICKGETNRSDFVNYITRSKIWPRINYYFVFNNQIFRRKIEICLDDCLAYGFINEKEFTVTKQGRDYIKLLGFLEEFLKRRKRTVVNSLSFMIGVLTAYLINLFYK